MARILIVDDNADEALVLQRHFAAAGHEVATALTGREALLHVLSDKPDVILLDLILPVMDGPSFLEVIRSYLRLQALPVVVLTGAPDSPMVERTRTQKVNEILVKGKATSEDIRRAVEKAVGTVPG